MDAVDVVLILLFVIAVGAIILYTVFILPPAVKALDGALDEAGHVIQGALARWDDNRQCRRMRKAEFLAAWAKIEPGLSEQDVIGHLGPPDEVIPVEPLVWRYRCEKLTGFVMFEAGHVTGYKKPEEAKA